MVETKFTVGMSCEGCASAIKRILNKVDGVHNVETNVESKTVLVDADPSITPQFIFEKLEKVSVRPSVSFRDTTRIVYACNVLSVYSCIVFFKIGVGKIEREVGRNGRVRLFVSARFVYHG
jgi:copper chaperone